MSLIDDHIHKGAARQFLVQASSSEIHISGDVITLVDDGLADQVFSAAPLVSRDNVFVTIVGLYCIFEMVKISTASISLIAQHHACPLAVAHRAGAAVGQEINIYFF